MPPQINFVSPTLAKEWVDKSEAVIVDVREKAEYEEERIKGAVFNPVSAFDAASVKRLCADGKKIVFQCRSGKRACMALETFLAACPDVGNERVFSMDGAITAWKEAGLPTEKPGPVSLERQVMAITGGLALAGTLLGWIAAPIFTIIPAMIGGGLLFAGLTGNCYLKKALMRLPYNNPKPPANFCQTR